MEIKMASPEYAGRLLAIYAPYVENTAITFEYEVPSEDEFARRIQKTLTRYPYLMAVEGDNVLGYAYLGPFVGRAAYDWAAETSIYLRMDVLRQGIGSMLYQSLEKTASAQNIINLNACIGFTEVEDAHLTQASVRFHESCGYHMVGTFRKCGYKFGTWYDMVWMEKHLGPHPETPPPLIPFPDLK